MNKLDAVNTILMAQGLNPASTLEGDLPRDTQTAIAVLDRTLSAFQTEAFFFNTERDYTLTVTPTGTIPVPPDVTQFVVPGQPWLEIRDGFLYDRRERANDKFTSAVSGHAKFEIEWDRLPVAARNYVSQRSARIAYESYLGSDETRENLYREELTARTTFEQDDAAQAGYSMLDDPRLPYINGSDYYPASPRNWS